MKHLKHIFEAKFGENEKEFFLRSKEVIQDLKDICLELQDDGFNIIVKPVGPMPEYLQITKIISKRIEDGGESRSFLHFEWGEVSEVVERIIHYMNMNKYNCQVMIGDQNSDMRSELGKERQMQPWSKTREVKIYFMLK